MKNTVFFGAGQIGSMLVRLSGADINPLCFIDNSKGKWGNALSGVKILSPDEGLKLNPDAVVICVLDEIRAGEMKQQLLSSGYSKEIIFADSLKTFDSRYATMRLLAEQIEAENIKGDVAELGVYKGEFASCINTAFKNRAIHLFDTFEGFAESDVQTEKSENFSRAKSGDFSDTSVETVKSKLPYPENAVFYKGFFPDTFAACKAEMFAFVSIDADLYEPTAAALPLFFNRLSAGGVLMIHDVNSTQFQGLKKAVDEFCRANNLLPMPVCDLHGSVVIRK